MRSKTTVLSLIFCIGCVLLLSASPGLFAQDEPVAKRIIIKGDDEGSGKGEMGYLGVLLEDITKSAIDRHDYPHETGVIIVNVVEESAAEKAGLEEDDIVYLFGGTKVRDASQLIDLVRKRKPGDKVTIVIYRDGKEKKVPVVLGKRAEISVVMEDFGKISDEVSEKLRQLKKSTVHLYSKGLLLGGRLGMVLEDLNDDLAEYFSAKEGDGVLVLDVKEDSPAARAGIRGGDIITRIDGTAVSNADELMEKLSAFEESDTVTVDVLRKGARKTLGIEIAKGSEEYQFHVAPFDRSGAEAESAGRYLAKKKSEEAARLKEEMQSLKEHLRELEERLDEVEKRK